MTGRINRRSSTPTPGLAAGVLTVGALVVLVATVSFVRFTGWPLAVAVAAIGTLSALARQRRRKTQAPTCVVCGCEFEPGGAFPLPAGRPGEVVHVHDGACLRTAAGRWARRIVHDYGAVPAVAAAHLLGEAAKEPDFASVRAALDRLTAEASGGAR